MSYRNNRPMHRLFRYEIQSLDSEKNISDAKMIPVRHCPAKMAVPAIFCTKIMTSLSDATAQRGILELIG